MTIDCSIKFGNSVHGAFISGQQLDGRVELKLSEAKKFNEICLKIVGYTAVSWTQKRGSGKRRRTVHYSARKDHLSSVTMLVAPNRNEPTEILAGEHIYNFSCHLPPTLPTSFEGTYGCCRYTIQVVLDRPWKFTQTYKVGFTVVQPVDLNIQSPALCIPAKMEDARVFCCGIWRTGPLYASIQVPCTGYVPGQDIPVAVELRNKSNRIVEGVNMKLIQTVTYISETPSRKTKEEKKTVVKHIGIGVAGDAQVKYEQRLEVLPVPPSRVSQIINISYKLHATVRVSGCGIDPVMEIPLTIGTVPLLQMSTMQPAVAGPSAGFNFGASDGQLPHPGPSAPPQPQQDAVTCPPEYLPPPTYEEAMNVSAAEIIDESDQHTIGWRPFIPRYPVYNFGSESPGPPPKQ